mgnify:FL=1
MFFRIKKRKAFSLIEILIVIAILFTLFTVSFSRFSFFNKFIVKSEVDNLYNTFYFLQQKAIAGNCEQKLYFDLNNNSYFYFLNGKKVNHKLANLVEFGFKNGVLGPPSSPVKPIKNTITFKKDKKCGYFTEFYSNGIIDSGTIYFVDRNYKYLFALTCPISQVSYIRKYQYLKNKWIIV